MHRYLLTFLALSSISFGAGRGNPEDEIPNFDLDDYYVEPKFSMHIGFRGLTGPKTAFRGTGFVTSFAQLQDAVSTDVVRGYHDGTVFVDRRDGAVDGQTRNWAYDDALQVINNGEDVAFHVYTAQITQGINQKDDQGLSLGTELVLSRDLGKIGNRIEWMLTGGISMNGLEASAQKNVMADITTITDVYSLNGQTLPSTLPYEAPTFDVDSNGDLVETTVVIGSRPDSRTETTTTNDTQISSFWKLRGTYLTVRLGPTFRIQITDKLRFIMSGGPVMVYSGSTYTVDRTFTVDTADPVRDRVSDSVGKIMTGYYADIGLEYLLSDYAGLYLGSFYQTAGSYTQYISEQASSYELDVDLSRLQGFRGGLNFKF
jgi:hypothetical protein